MYAPSFRLVSFDLIPPGYKTVILHHLLDALIIANVAYLLTHRQTPLLYESGVRYVPEPDDRDEWQDIPDTLQRRGGDCEDLGCWLIAERRVVFGETATEPDISEADLPDSSGRMIRTYHIRVRHPDGRITDPSKVLGMR